MQLLSFGVWFDNSDPEEANYSMYAAYLFKHYVVFNHVRADTRNQRTLLMCLFSFFLSIYKFCNVKISPMVGFVKRVDFIGCSLYFIFKVFMTKK